jgi:glycerol-3-phosphate dehydrogenase
VTTLATRIGVDMPISFAVDRILKDATSIDDEIRGLLARPLKHES